MNESAEKPRTGVRQGARTPSGSSTPAAVLYEFFGNKKPVSRRRNGRWIPKALIPVRNQYNKQKFKSQEAGLFSLKLFTIIR